MKGLIQNTPSMTQTAYTVVVIAALALASCGWGYARESVGERELRENTRRVEIDQVDPEKAAIARLAQQKSAAQHNGCPVQSFTLFLIEESGSRSTKDIGCSDGQVLSLSRKDIDLGEVRTFREMNVPVGKWYLLVDAKNPQPNHQHAVSNKALIELNRRYGFRYYDRMPNEGLVIYTFESTTGQLVPTAP